MPTATILANMLRLKPRSSAMGRKNGPMPMRRPTVSKVRIADAATMFQPKYHLADGEVLKASLLYVMPQATACYHHLILPIALRSEEHTSELQSRENLVCRLLLEKKKKK